MLRHPLLLAVLGADIAAVALLASAAFSCARIVLHWRPAVADGRQLSLEGQAEAVSIKGRWIFALNLFALLLLVFGISNVFPRLTPGAMCGTGVLQALGDDGPQLLLYRLLAVAVLLCWYELDRLNRMQPDGPLTMTGARLLLVAVPLCLPAVYISHTAFRHVDPHRPVNCCAVVYDQFQSLQQARSMAGLPDTWWLAALLFLSLILGVLSLDLRAARGHRPCRRNLLAVTALLWLPVAFLALTRVLAAYHYQVLQHECPWCLFLPDHHFIGFPLFGLMGMVAAEGAMAGLLPALVRHHPAVRDALEQRIRRSARRLGLALLLFLVLAGLPAVVWRLRFGVWMGG